MSRGWADGTRAARTSLSPKSNTRVCSQRAKEASSEFASRLEVHPTSPCLICGPQLLRCTRSLANARGGRQNSAYPQTTCFARIMFGHVCVQAALAACGDDGAEDAANNSSSSTDTSGRGGRQAGGFDRLGPDTGSQAPASPGAGGKQQVNPPHMLAATLQHSVPPSSDDSAASEYVH